MADTKVADLTASSGLANADLFYTVKDPAGTPLDRKLTGLQLRAGTVLARFLPMSKCGPATLYATLDTIAGASTPAESVPVLDFDDTTVEYADFYGYMPLSYGGGGVTITFIHSAAANTGVFGINAAFRLVEDDGEDLDTTAFTYDYNEVAATVANVVGKAAYDTLAFTDGADMDSVTAGSYFILRVKRNTSVASDATGDCSIHKIVIRET
jgi:hypothetical protein